MSKPIVPPWNDGSKNLVRDLAAHLRATVTVTTEPGKVALLGKLLRDRDHDLWHFVFAPNMASSGAARLAMGIRRSRPVVQTIASRAKSPNRRLIFGDVVVALSEHARGSLIGMGIAASRIRVIPPCAPRPDATPERIAAVRKMLDVGDAPIVLYPGDYEVSTGADTVARAVSAIVRAIPEARVVFACRRKTDRADEAKRAIEAVTGKDAKYTVHAGDVSDMPALIAAANVIVFPVDDLYGKVDIPLVLLEALSLGIPMVLARGGPLESIATGRFVEPRDADALSKNTLELLRGGRDAGRAGVGLWEERFTPQRIAGQHDDLYAELLRAKSNGPPK